MIKQYSNKYIFIIMGLLVIFALFLQYSVDNSTKKLKEEEVRKAEQYAKSISQYITLKTSEYGKFNLDENVTTRMELNKILRTFLTKEYQYIFLLHKDKKGHYRFLLDGSKEEPVEYNTLFFPKSKQFDIVYISQKPQIIEQKEGVEHVWLSLLFPIVIEGETEALLVMDMSKIYGEYLSDFNSPIVNIIQMMQLFLLFSFIFLAYFAYQYHQLRKSILIDALTLTHTKAYLYEFFDVNKVNEYNAMLIDIDSFKTINEKYGYEFGSIVLKQFASNILEMLTKNMKVIRVGGSEFLIVLKKEYKLNEVAENIFESLTQKRYLINNETIALTISMSALEVPLETNSIFNVQRCLDEKLLEIKSRGKNELSIIGNVVADTLRYKDLDYVKEALEDERLVCIYQPIFDIKLRKIIKYEALVRLVDKEEPEKLIPPSYFLTMIKGTTQYIKMSKLVLQEVFATLHQYPDVELSLNLDLDDLYNADMMELIEKQLYRHRSLAQRLTFEILESHEIKDYERVALIFQKLKTFGSKIAIDDFGSGYANYVYLIKLDIDILKIDGSIIEELLHTCERTKIMLESIKSLAELYDYELVAEFVSQKEIYELIKELDIPYAQGYYLGKPKPIKEYIDKEQN